MLRDLADVSCDNITRSKNIFYQKHANLDVKKVVAKIVNIHMNRLVLLPKLGPARQKNTSVIPMKKLTYQWYWNLIIFYLSHFISRQHSFFHIRTCPLGGLMLRGRKRSRSRVTQCSTCYQPEIFEYRSIKVSKDGREWNKREHNNNEFGQRVQHITVRVASGSTPHANRYFVQCFFVSFWKILLQFFI